MNNSGSVLLNIATGALQDRSKKDRSQYTSFLILLIGPFLLLPLSLTITGSHSLSPLQQPSKPSTSSSASSTSSSTPSSSATSFAKKRRRPSVGCKRKLGDVSAEEECAA